MSSIIRLLSDKVANQIAAGEVIQRPASAIKELLENSIDAESKKIQVVIKDAGKALIQVIDDGKGMDELDARMCFERHATSKIATADDLFNLQSKGFRGEALASIAAIAQVSLTSKTEAAELGTEIKIEGSKVLSQEPVGSHRGSNFRIKNLFFNVPARRNFLKSNPVELRHIIDEVERVAIPHCDIHFTLIHNDNILLDLPASNQRQRIVNIFGKKYNERLVPLDQKTDLVNISGYLIKPEKCKRTRGEQFFFVNNRFIKSHYLHHAIKAAYDGLIAKEQFPGYFVFLDVNPATIDINIHPTKTEVKFEDEKSIYAFLNSTARNSLGKFNVMPSIDFTQDKIITDLKHISKNQTVFQPEIKVNTNYNPFKTRPAEGYHPDGIKGDNYRIKSSPAEIEANLDLLKSNNNLFSDSENQVVTSYFPEEKAINSKQQYDVDQVSQIYNSFVLCKINGSIVTIDQRRAHKQVLFEQFLKQESVSHSQKLLYPKSIKLEPVDFAVVNEIIEEVNAMGFELVNLGGSTIAVNALPVGVQEEKVEELLQEFVEACKNESTAFENTGVMKTAWALASASAINRGRKLKEEEMYRLVEDLLKCTSQKYDAIGNVIMIENSLDTLKQKFGIRI